MTSKSLIDILLKNAAATPGVDVGLLETHISWVLMIGEFVYKIKKPVNLGFLDFTSLEQRKHFCQEELRLNRRFSPQLYLDVVSITGEECSPVIVEGIATEEDVLDYAVKMCRFQQDELVSYLLQQEKLNVEHFENLGRTLAKTYAALKPVKAASAGSLQGILAPAKDNFSAMASLITNSQHREKLEKLESWTDRYAEKLAPRFIDRKSRGFIKDCHGDLHTGNLAYINDKFVLFDCIEFSEAFRVHDVICDIAILLMDLEAKGKASYSYRVLYGYLEQSGDYGALHLLQFYKLYYAMVRAKVSFIRAQQLQQQKTEKQEVEKQGEPDAKNQAIEEAETYLNLGGDYVASRRPRLLITCGISGSGKTTVAKQVLDEHGVILLRSDVERKRLFGLAASDHSDACAKDIYTPEATELTFNSLYEMAKGLLESNISVLVDGTFLKRRLRHRFMKLAEEIGAGFSIVHCLAKESSLTHRIEERERSNNDASEANVTVMKQQLNKFEAFSAEELACVVEINTDKMIVAGKFQRLFS